jgi:uncharacterized protein
MPIQVERQPPELFVIPDDKGSILYAPLRRVMARANAEAIRIALDYAANPASAAALSDDGRATIQALEKHGFFERRPFPGHVPHFRPTQVTLFPTNRCNLRCSYCYAFGGEGGVSGEQLTTLSLDAARRAIDFIAQNARELATEGLPCKNFLVSIHGNGEPFSAFERLREIVWYARDVSEKLDFPVVLNTATNGVLNAEQLEFLVANFNNVNISFDGLPELQDAQRPLADGSGSFAFVDRTMRRLAEAEVNFGIRTTVTEATVVRMAEIAAHVADNYPGVEQLHLEPVWECGRCVTSSDSTPSAELFCENYLKALDVAGNKGLRLVYSGARQDMITDAFCKVSSGSYTVTPTGDVTACYEVSYRSDPRSERYFFGHFDPKLGDYVYDEDKLRELAELNVKNIPFCTDCFCRWHCAGDCAAKVLEGRTPVEHQGSQRCVINRKLTLNQIQRKMDWREEGAGQ